MKIAIERRKLKTLNIVGYVKTRLHRKNPYLSYSETLHQDEVVFTRNLSGDEEERGCASLVPSATLPDVLIEKLAGLMRAVRLVEGGGRCKQVRKHRYTMRYNL